MKCIIVVTPTSLSEDNLIFLTSTLALLHTMDEYSTFWSFYMHQGSKHMKPNSDKLAYLISSSGIIKGIHIDSFNSPELAIICSFCKGRKINFEKVHLIFLEDFPVSVETGVASVINLIRILGLKTSFLTSNIGFDSEDFIRLINLGCSNWPSMLISSILLEANIEEKTITKGQTPLSDKSLFWLCTNCFKGKNLLT